MQHEVPSDVAALVLEALDKGLQKHIVNLFGVLLRDSSSEAEARFWLGVDNSIETYEEVASKLKIRIEDENA